MMQIGRWLRQAVRPPTSSSRKLTRWCATLEPNPKTVIEVRPDLFVYYLDQNMVGWVRLKVQGSVGQRVQLRYAEMLNLVAGALLRIENWPTASVV